MEKKREIKALIHREEAEKKNILYFILFCGSCLCWAHINSSGPFMHFNSVALSRRSTYFICNPLYLEPEILACQGKWQERRREERKGRKRAREGEKNTRAQCEFPRTSENCSAAQNSEVISSPTACDGPCRACVCVSMCMSVCNMCFLTGLWHSIGQKRYSLEAPVISPDLFKGFTTPTVFIMTISNFNFQFFPPSFQSICN